MEDKKYITIDEAKKIGYTHAICAHCLNPTMINIEDLEKTKCCSIREFAVLNTKQTHFLLKEDDMISEIQDYLEAFAIDNGSNKIDWDYKRVFEKAQVKEQWKLFVLAVNNAIEDPKNGVGYYKATDLHIKISGE